MCTPVPAAEVTEREKTRRCLWKVTACYEMCIFTRIQHTKAHATREHVCNMCVVCFTDSHFILREEKGFIYLDTFLPIITPLATLCSFMLIILYQRALQLGLKITPEPLNVTMNV